MTYQISSRHLSAHFLCPVLWFSCGFVTGGIFAAIAFALFLFPYGYVRPAFIPFVAIGGGIQLGMKAVKWQRNSLMLRKVKVEQREMYEAYTGQTAYTHEDANDFNEEFLCATAWFARAFLPGSTVVVVNFPIALLFKGIDPFIAVLVASAPYFFVQKSLPHGGWEYKEIERQVRGEFPVPEDFAEQYQSQQQ